MAWRQTVSKAQGARDSLLPTGRLHVGKFGLDCLITSAVLLIPHGLGLSGHQEMSEVTLSPYS